MSDQLELLARLYKEKESAKKAQAATAVKPQLRMDVEMNENVVLPSLVNPAPQQPASHSFMQWGQQFLSTEQQAQQQLAQQQLAQQQELARQQQLRQQQEIARQQQLAQQQQELAARRQQEIARQQQLAQQQQEVQRLQAIRAQEMQQRQQQQQQLRNIPTTFAAPQQAQQPSFGAPQSLFGAPQPAFGAPQPVSMTPALFSPNVQQMMRTSHILGQPLGTTIFNHVDPQRRQEFQQQVQDAAQSMSNEQAALTLRLTRTELLGELMNKCMAGEPATEQELKDQVKRLQELNPGCLQHLKPEDLAELCAMKEGVPQQVMKAVDRIAGFATCAYDKAEESMSEVSPKWKTLAVLIGALLAAPQMFSSSASTQVAPTEPQMYGIQPSHFPPRALQQIQKCSSEGVCNLEDVGRYNTYLSRHVGPEGEMTGENISLEYQLKKIDEMLTSPNMRSNPNLADARKKLNESKKRLLKAYKKEQEALKAEQEETERLLRESGWGTASSAQQEDNKPYLSGLPAYQKMIKDMEKQTAELEAAKAQQE